jgi:hypothetical protein
MKGGRKKITSWIDRVVDRSVDDDPSEHSYIDLYEVGPIELELGIHSKKIKEKRIRTWNRSILFFSFLRGRNRSIGSTSSAHACERGARVLFQLDDTHSEKAFPAIIWRIN